MSKVLSTPVNLDMVAKRAALVAAEDALEDAVIALRRANAAPEVVEAKRAEKWAALKALHEFEATMPLVAPASLTKAYGPHAKRVLLDHHYLVTVHVDRGEDKRSLERFALLKALPSLEEYHVLRDKTFTTTVGALVADAFSEFNDLHGELSDWYDGMPENFQNGSKGDEVSEARDGLESCTGDEFEVREPLADIPVVYLPSDTESRADRCAEAVNRLRCAIEALNDAAVLLNDAASPERNEDADLPAWMEDAEDSPDKLRALADAAEEHAGTAEEVCDNAEGVTFPGMY
jgi:hypothetical protein